MDVIERCLISAHDPDSLPDDWDGTPRDAAICLFHSLRACGVVLTRVNQSLHAATSVEIPASERQAMERYALDLMAMLYAIELQDPRALVWLGGGEPTQAWSIDPTDPSDSSDDVPCATDQSDASPAA